MRFIDLEDRILGAVFAEIVRTVLDPTVEDGLMAHVIVAAADHELLLDPDQRPATGKPRGIHRADEIGQQRSTGDGRVDAGARLGERDAGRERFGEELAGFLWSSARRSRSGAGPASRGR